MAKREERKTVWYYKTEDGKGWLKDYVQHNDPKYIEITEAEWNEHIASLHHEPTAEELALREKKKQISRFKAFLKDTDWVIVKIAEETDAEQIAALREKYADIIALRKNARTQINELEGE